jgi:hypothetical protein
LLGRQCPAPAGLDARDRGFIKRRELPGPHLPHPDGEGLEQSQPFRHRFGGGRISTRLQQLIQRPAWYRWKFDGHGLNFANPRAKARLDIHLYKGTIVLRKHERLTSEQCAASLERSRAQPKPAQEDDAAVPKNPA